MRIKLRARFSQSGLSPSAPCGNVRNEALIPPNGTYVTLCVGIDVAPRRRAAGGGASLRLVRAADSGGNEHFEIDADELEVDYSHLRKFVHAAHEFAVYINSNAGGLINYGERYRTGERISSCLAESTVNAVISGAGATDPKLSEVCPGARYPRVSYWREEPHELDGVLEGPWGSWAIEIKTGTFRTADLHGLLEFPKTPRELSAFADLRPRWAIHRGASWRRSCHVA